MNIEEYLSQKRSLEKRKEELEGKEKLREQSQKVKKELFKEKTPFFHHPTQRESFPQERPPSKPAQPPADSYDPIRKMIVWNMLLLLVIVVMGVVLFFVISDDTPQQIIVQTPNITKDASTTPVDTSTNTTEGNVSVEEDPELYEGPDVEFYARDAGEPSYGLFDSKGRLSSGEFLVILGDYYQDLELQFKNLESTRVICFVDRETDVDVDFDGKVHLRDTSERITVEKLSRYEIAPSFPDTLPSGLGDAYKGQGKVTADYTAKCYYCTNKDCEQKKDEPGPGWDENGETIRTARVVVSLHPPSSENNSSSTN